MRSAVRRGQEKDYSCGDFGSEEVVEGVLGDAAEPHGLKERRQPQRRRSSLKFFSFSRYPVFDSRVINTRRPQISLEFHPLATLSFSAKLKTVHREMRKAYAFFVGVLFFLVFLIFYFRRKTTKRRLPAKFHRQPSPLRWLLLLKNETIVSRTTSRLFEPAVSNLEQMPI